MEETKRILTQKVKKHQEKLKAHSEAEKVLKLELAELEDKKQHLEEKILSSTKGVEYHTGKLKAYQKSLELISE